MTTKTRTDLINQALSILGVLAAGQVPSAEDTAAVGEHVEPLFASLDKRNIVTVDDADAIPLEWFLSLATLLADAASDEFGLPGVPPSASNRDPVGDAIMELREMEYARPTYERMRGEYF